MKRVIVVYNLHSSRYADVKSDVIERLPELKGYVVGKYEVEKGNVDDNAAKLAKLLRNDDLVVAAGGDATGVIAVNAILRSDKDVTLAALPYGNFNDLARTLGTKTFEDVFVKKTKVAKFYPLELLVNDKLFRYATCYATIGMTAEAVRIYDTPRMRKILKKSMGRSVGSYTNLARWYFKHRRKKQFLPKFKLNGVLQPDKTSDYAAINGRYMARVMKGGEYFKNSSAFRSETDRLTKFWRLTVLMTRSIFNKVPGIETEGDVLEFLELVKVDIQAEGEYKTFDNVKKIEVRKCKKCLKVIMR